MQAPVRCALLGWVAAVAVAGSLAWADVAGPAATVTVRGTVTDAAGAPVPVQTVRILKTRKLRSARSMHGKAQEVEEARVKTDADGRFSVDVPVDHVFPFWFVRFYDPKQFDAVKYLVPQDVEISRMMDGVAPIEVGVVLQLHPDWPKVRALVDEFGPASRRGQIVRSLGLPSSRTPDGEGREVWVYAAAGVTYVLQGDAVIETRRTPAAAPAAGSDAPIPAEKADAP